MKTIATTKKLFIVGTLFLFSIAMQAEPKDKVDFNHLEYNLGKAKVMVDYKSTSIEKTSIDELNTALFSFSRDMVVNHTHLRKGEYEVSLKEQGNDLVLVFESMTDDRKIKEVQLEGTKSEKSEFINVKLEQIEEDKLLGNIDYGHMEYQFEMEVSLSNKIFAYFQREEVKESADWLDYYQTAIYAYKHDIDLSNSYQLAQKALEQEQNEHTIQLSMLYLEALGRDDEAQQLSALHEK